MKLLTTRSGRTGRIGNHGLATTFYNSNDEGIAPDLVKILIECEQEVPSFLEEFKPDDEHNLKWEDDEGSDAESDAGGGESGDMGGGGGGDDSWGDQAGATAAGGSSGGGEGW